MFKRISNLMKIGALKKGKISIGVGWVDFNLSVKTNLKLLLRVVHPLRRLMISWISQWIQGEIRICHQVWWIKVETSQWRLMSKEASMICLSEVMTLKSSRSTMTSIDRMRPWSNRFLLKMYSDLISHLICFSKLSVNPWLMKCPVGQLRERLAVMLNTMGNKLKVLSLLLSSKRFI